MDVEGTEDNSVQQLDVSQSETEMSKIQDESREEGEQYSSILNISTRSRDASLLEEMNASREEEDEETEKKPTLELDRC